MGLAPASRRQPSRSSDVKSALIRKTISPYARPTNWAVFPVRSWMKVRNSGTVPWVKPALSRITAVLSLTVRMK